jgi:UDP-N-acetylglucosamine kinase
MLIEITDEKSEEIFNDILFDFTFAKTTQIKPLGIILGGQPGAGKSYLVKEVEDEFQKDFIFISTDDLRLYHPAYATLQQNPETLQNAANLVNPYASAWTERLIKHCIENKFNLIDSTLGGNIYAVYQTVDMLRDNDFSFHLRLMAVPAFISKLSIFLRYESQLKEKGLPDGHAWKTIMIDLRKFRTLRSKYLPQSHPIQLDFIKEFYQKNRQSP